ncbi:hypothetical protein [Streptomyces sp. Qhu_M48]|uniref:hypothetical protein n=1 Tax=Streptomyces sp. Qhu_M48 TaxID=3435889 RepID=UPI003F5029FF
MTVQLPGLNIADHMGELVRQDIDAVFLRPAVPDGIELQYLGTEPRVVCLAAAADPVAAFPHLTLAHLRDRAVVDVPPQVPRTWWNFWAVHPRPDCRRVTYGPVVTDMESLLHTVGQGESRDRPEVLPPPRHPLPGRPRPVAVGMRLYVADEAPRGADHCRDPAVGPLGHPASPGARTLHP